MAELGDVGRVIAFGFRLAGLWDSARDRRPGTITPHFGARVISGTVTVGGAPGRVRLRLLRGPELLGMQLAAPDGSYQWHCVPPGRYQVVAEDLDEMYRAKIIHVDTELP